MTQPHSQVSHKFEDVSIPTDKVAAYNVPFMLLPLLAFLIYMINFGPETLILAIHELKDLYRLSILFVGGIFVHEVLHMVSWSIFSGMPLRAFRVGFKINLYLPYVFCIYPITITSFRVGLLVPFLFMGVLPLSMAFYFENILLLLFGLIFCLWASGDLLLFVLLLKMPSKCLVSQHHEKFGCMVHYPEE